MAKLERRMAGVANQAGKTAATALYGLSGELPHLIEVDVDAIDPNPEQPRSSFDETRMRELADSIERHGLKQPILVQKGQGGRFTLVAGERRWRAHQMLGKTRILGIITSGDLAELALIENLQRQDLNAVEEARGLQKLQQRHGYSQREMAAVIGRSQPEINRVLGLLALPAVVLDEFLAGHSHISKSVLAEIAATDPEFQMALWERAKLGASVVALRQERAQLQAPAADDARPPAAAPPIRPPAMLSARQVLKSLGKAAADLAGYLDELDTDIVPLTDDERQKLMAMRDSLDLLLGK
ncbi:MAG TPA: ParB/RepB/Spo0J family partition protein [Patescibacteria group bacterium]|nr:ParB/RepB/Spo0J family partition protein [Patescibacteria group bacterium]